MQFQTKRVELKAHIKKQFIEPMFKDRHSLNVAQWRGIIVAGAKKRTTLQDDTSFSWETNFSESTQRFFFAHFRQYLAPQHAQDFMNAHNITEEDLQSIKSNKRRKSVGDDPSLPAPSSRRKTTKNDEPVSQESEEDGMGDSDLELPSEDEEEEEEEEVPKRRVKKKTAAKPANKKNAKKN